MAKDVGQLIAGLVLGALIAGGASPGIAAEPAAYGVDFVSTAATGVAMNAAGEVIGSSYVDIGCGSTCLPPLETVVWRSGERIVLPPLPGFTGISVRGINADGWIAGTAGGMRTVVWKPVGDTYEIVDVGGLPGATVSYPVGIDDLGRVVGWSTIPPGGAPFVWSEGSGIASLAAQGFPNDIPLAISPGGTVATTGHWYRLDDPASVAALAPPPPGFSGPGSYPAAINDAGDQVRFQISTSTQFFPYLFRYSHTGTWQQLWFLPAGNLAPWGIGGITEAGDITATVGGVGLIAYGPDGLARPLADKLSPAYGGADVTIGGPIDAAGQILAQVIVGQSQRLVRLVPAEVCAASCVRVASVQMRGQFINDPANPGQCTPAAANRVWATITVTDELGNPLRGVSVAGRFLDDYWTDAPVTRPTNRRGTARFTYSGPACVGAIAFLVDTVTGSGRVFDPTAGVLTNSVIPLP